ncbi:Txe/YoeB family addiction module toxin [Geminocystis sp. CENA526]|uniref:Txe/YoeB family addiction module toxin n=1 Tax=Geminocystis sp. CENA526 TaxID=1355871 RepID=UPI003D6F863F
MRSLIFEGKTWLVYENLREKDKKLHQNLCKILKEMLRSDPTQGLGKPEPLKHNLSGLWSRRLSQKDRIVYKFDAQYIYIFAIGGHYENE